MGSRDPDFSVTGESPLIVGTEPGAKVTVSTLGRQFQFSRPRLQSVWDQSLGKRRDRHRNPCNVVEKPKVKGTDISPLLLS